MSSVLRHSGYRSASERAAVGDTKTSMVRVDHLGWLVCDGRSLLRSEYRNLFAVIGTEFGSDDSIHFNLPDARGRVVGLIGVAVDVSSHEWFDGDVSGEYQHTLTISEIPAHNHDISGGYLNVSGGVVPTNDGNTSLDGTHTHGITDPGHAHTGVPNQASTAIDGASNNTGNGTNTGTSTTGITILSNGAHRHQIASNGGSLPHNNIQPTIFMGNLFIYCGQPLRNITGPDGLTAPVSNPSYYPPSDVFTNRLY